MKLNIGLQLTDKWLLGSPLHVLPFACFFFSFSIRNKLLLPHTATARGRPLHAEVDHKLQQPKLELTLAEARRPLALWQTSAANLLPSFIYSLIYLFLTPSPRHVKRTSALSSSHICRSPASVSARRESPQTAAAACESRGGSSEKLCRECGQSATLPPVSLCLSRSIFAAIAPPSPLPSTSDSIN